MNAHKSFLFLLVLIGLMNTACLEIPGQYEVKEPQDLDGKSDYLNDLSMPETKLSSEQTVQEDGSISIELFWDEVSIGTVEKAAPADGYEVQYFDQAGSNIYIAINNTGLGGAILYGGAHSLYEYNLNTKELSKVFETDTGFATDVSPNGERIATFSLNVRGEYSLQIVSTEKARNQGEAVEMEFPIPSDSQAGDGVFSPDSKKLAYAATLSMETDREESSIFIVDLELQSSEEWQKREGTLEKLSWDSGEEPTIQ